MRISCCGFFSASRRNERTSRMKINFPLFTEAFEVFFSGDMSNELGILECVFHGMGRFAFDRVKEICVSLLDSMTFVHVGL